MTYYSARLIVRQSFVMLVFCTILEIFGGTLIHTRLETLIMLPIILTMLPVINGVGGNIGSIISMRLTSGLHTGTIEVAVSDRELLKNVGGAALLGALSFGILGVAIVTLAPYLGLAFPPALYWKLLGIIFFAGILLTCVVIIVALVSATISFNRGIDPDNTVTPLVTTTGDLVGILLLMVMITLVGI